MFHLLKTFLNTFQLSKFLDIICLKDNNLRIIVNLKSRQINSLKLRDENTGKVHVEESKRSPVVLRKFL